MLLGESLSPAHRRFLFVDNGVFAFIINFVLALGFGWLFFRNLARVPMWGQSSIAGDTIITCILLPLFTCLIVSAIARSQMRAGNLASVRGGAALGWFPASSFLRGLIIGVALLPFLIPITLMGLKMAGVVSLSFGQFLLFKAVFSAFEGGLVTPFIALLAISRSPDVAVSSPLTAS